MPVDTLTADGDAVTLALPSNLSSGFDGQPFTEAGYAAVNLVSNEVVVDFNAGNQAIAAAGYDLQGHVLFSSVLRAVGDSAGSSSSGGTGTYGSLTAPAISMESGGGVVVGYGANVTWSSGEVDPVGDIAVISANGTIGASGYGVGGWNSDHTAVYGPTGVPELFPDGSGWLAEYVEEGHGSYPTEVWQQTQQNYSQTPAPGGLFHAEAATSVSQGPIVFADNEVYQDSGSNPVATVPLEGANAITNEAAATLAGGQVVLAWADSGAAHAAFYNYATHSFGPVTALGAGDSNVHVVALMDGGYAISWTNGGQHQGEVFDSAGNGGGVLGLTGDFAGVTPHGDVYTVGLGANGQYVVQAYAPNGWTGGNAGAGAGSGSAVSTSDANYTAPDGVGTITLTGSHQTVTANNGGDIINSNDSGNVLNGGTGNDVFNLGRGGDVVTGGGGNDDYVYADIPWGAGQITDFNAGDLLDLTGLVSHLGFWNNDHPADPWGQGFLELVDDGQGDTQVWARYETSGSHSAWWEVTALKHVALSTVQINGDLIATTTGASSGGGSGGGPGQTYASDNNGDTWVGTSGDDTFHLGRGGDVVTGNGGNDAYDFAEIPWAGGHITDFNAGDVLDLSGLMSTTADTRSDGFADGYLQITDSSGGAEVWAQYATSGSSSGWWLVETLDGVSASSLTTHGDVVTVGSAPSGPSSVSTSDSNYVAPSYVTSITLTGSQQHIDASATTDVTITSNNTGNTLIGGAGDDIFHLGRGGDMVTGGTGSNDFAYAETPWAGGTITNFDGAHDEIDVSGLLAKSGYTGSDPFADGYLQLTSDTNGNAQLWSDVHQSGNDGWWLVATLDGVSTSSLHYSGGLIT